jgi:hypothetical protein
VSLPKTLLVGALGGGGTARYGDFVLVKLPNGGFAASAQDFNTAQNWARGKMSSGNAQRDRSLFTDRFETLLARSGSGIATKGSRATLRGIIAGLTQLGVQMSGYSVPININDSVEIERKKPAA